MTSLTVNNLTVNNKVQIELFERIDLKFHNENLTSLIFVNNKIQFKREVDQPNIC